MFRLSFAAILSVLALLTVGFMASPTFAKDAVGRASAHVHHAARRATHTAKGAVHGVHNGVKNATR